jgi:hypothetical protein
MHDRGGRQPPARPPRRRRRPPLAVLPGLLLALVLAVAACSSDGDNSDGVASLSGANKATTTTKPLSKQDTEQGALKFARCMRQHGIDMPDPQISGNRIAQGLGGKGPDDPKFKAAQQACNQYMPNGGQPTKPNAQQQQQMLQFARCMRQHGINMPDPDANGGTDLSATKVKPDDPKFKAAEQACAQYQPKGEKQTQTDGGSQ